MSQRTLRRMIIAGGVVLVLAAMNWRSGQSQTLTGKRNGTSDTRSERNLTGASTTDQAADQEAIRANIARFEEAYNARDAQAIAALFTANGRIIDKDGRQSEGREAIAQVFTNVFAAAPENRIEVYVDSIEFLDAGLAIETGTTKELPPTDESPAYDRYTVVHVKRDGQWQMALARDEEGPPPSAHERLQPLAWLVGEWIDDDGSSVVASTCRWSDDGNFLLQEFKLELHGDEAMNVSQRIGWDPIAKCIRSWVFDSEGGFGQSMWSPSDNGWVIKATGVRPDGTTGSATNRLVLTGGDSYVWETSDRVVAGEPQPSMQVKIVRKPPEPAN
ncbi:MAG: SgcJ/EcaC family oxidoreductase [Planctomycetaceae bacterium]|nr:SgcJ/EcaC family oxidoreductase [Planctomycetaceae bacterium]